MAVELKKYFSEWYSTRIVALNQCFPGVFRYVCMLGCEITQKVLEDYDKKLHNERDKKVYRDKGKRTTSIKTVYGDVTYSRCVYRTKTEAGETAYVYLLDKAMHMEKIRLISTNLAERIAMTVTASGYTPRRVLTSADNQALFDVAGESLRKRTRTRGRYHPDTKLCSFTSAEKRRNGKKQKNPEGLPTITLHISIPGIDHTHWVCIARCLQ